jgi:hypothetical protein
MVSLEDQSYISPDSDKRVGGVFDDFDLGIDFDDDDDDPNDRRRSQYIMKAKLDEIERVGLIAKSLFLVFDTTNRT